jgi:hypothetical protein
MTKKRTRFSIYSTTGTGSFLTARHSDANFCKRVAVPLQEAEYEYDTAN